MSLKLGGLQAPVSGKSPTSGRVSSAGRRWPTGEEDGFSLLELMITVAVLLILAAMMVPNYVGSKKAANEAVAISYMRSWSSAQQLYHLKYGRYADDDDLLVAEGLIGVDNPDRLGYAFSIDVSTGQPQRWWGTAAPTMPGITGSRFFYIDDEGVIRFSVGSEADSSSPALSSSSSAGATQPCDPSASSAQPCK